MRIILKELRTSQPYDDTERKKPFVEERKDHWDKGNRIEFEVLPALLVKGNINLTYPMDGFIENAPSWNMFFHFCFRL